MGRDLVLGLLLAAGAAVLGFTMQDQHYRLDVVHLPTDQQVIAHRDSAYTGMTWVASESNNYLQLRFFEMVEGGVCLRPTWAELAAEPRLPHLRPATPPAPAALDPGTLNNSPYISFFPAGILLNRNVPEAPQVLVVGLGSGVGIAQLAHHFPRAVIEVVDIDPAVITMVREHYPLLAWLETQDRLRFVARDARAHVRARQGHGFHLVVLDAYTAGSTIPPHLMTREFFAECAATLADGGTVLANVIGCYGEQDATGAWQGPKRKVMGGALRSLRAAGLPEAWVIPVLGDGESPSSFRQSSTRNNIIIAGKHALAPGRFREGWERLRAWVPFPELATGRYVSRQYILIDQGEKRYASTFAPAEVVDAAVPDLRLRLVPAPAPPADAPAHTITASSEEAELIRQAAAAVVKAGGQVRGWRSPPSRAVIQSRSIDWTLFPRETWRASVAFARDETKHHPDLLVGPVDGPEREGAPQSWHMTDAPLFTDQTPNADIVNR